MSARWALSLTLGVLLATAGATPALADTGVADLVVTVTASKAVVDRSAGVTVETFIRNDGTAPATDVAVTLTEPVQFGGGSMESTSDFDCDFGRPEGHCLLVEPLAPGRSLRVMSEWTSGFNDVQPGDVLTAAASATTSAPESDTTNNSDSKQIRIVDDGIVRGAVWNDLNADGIWQPTEPVAGTIGLLLDSQEDDDQFGSATSSGVYSYTVPAKRYVATATLSAWSWQLTTPGGDSAFHATGATTVASDPFTVDPATPTVLDLGVVPVFRPTAVTPDAAPAGGTATVTLTGAKFSVDMKVTLTRPGSPAIKGKVAKVGADLSTMKVKFPLDGAAPGSYTLTVKNAAGDRAELADAFTVTA
jgi:hypothetical protein